ncbi:hypothetical protein MMC18_002201 [Xylographa bjoerkii]|nr:hypothetical protein [Xylographa bjoerkii]
MLPRKPSPPILHLSTPSPDYSPRSSTVFSDCDADDEGAMSAEDLVSSRPPSDSNSSFNAVGPYCPRIPTLRDVLSNSSPSPWTLSAFTAYLSQNHCLETLEFTTDAERYRAKYDAMAEQMAGMPMTPDMDDCDEVRRLWQKLMDAYIVPDAPREVNLPSDVRDRLLSLPNHTSPPTPEELNAAIKRTYELMDDSVLIPFINELSPSRDTSSLGSPWNDSDENLPMRMSMDDSFQRTRPRRKGSPPLSAPPHSAIDSSHISHNSPLFNRLSQTPSLPHSLGRGRLATNASGSSTGSGDLALTDDSGSLSSPNKEPMTPPTTPPSSDIGGHSPRNRTDNTWKTLMGRLGSKKKSASRMGRIDDSADT